MPDAVSMPEEADEEESSRHLTINTDQNITYDFGPQFTNIQPLGHGASGLTFSARDEERKRDVAIKTLALPNGQTGQQTLREIKILSRLKHENVVEILDITARKGGGDGVGIKQVLVIQELLDTDLHSVIADKQLQEEHVVFFTYQLLRGLKYIHSFNVIHRDLKPCNILLNCHTLQLKITDFGISRIVDPSYNHKGLLSPYAGSCWYHAPEQLVSPRTYSNAVDVWAAGCILMEMLTSTQLFSSATTPLEQLRQIIDVVFLSERDWSCVLRIMPNKMLKNHSFKPRRTIASRLAAKPAAINLVERLLTFEAEQRPGAAALLAHPYLQQYHMPTDEPTALSPLHIEHEVDHELTPQTLCCMMVQECRLNPAAATNESVASRTQRSLPVPCASPPLSCTDEMHTLDEILSLQDSSIGQIEIDDDEQVSSSSSSSTSSHRSSSVEDLNLRNLQNSQEKLMTSSSYNILQLGEEEILHIQEEPPQKEEKHDEKEIDEKDVAELSVQKLEEDKELERIIQSYNNLSIQTNRQQLSTPSPHSQSPKSNEKLQVCIEHKRQQETLLLAHTPPRARSPSCNRCVYISDDEEFKEKKLLEMQSASGGGTLSKVKADNMESEKNDQDLDERYRLPTEHLRREDNNRDYSNRRLKHKHLSKIHVRQLLRYRDEINELNERLREEGACGGYEEEESEEGLGDGEIVLTSTRPGVTSPISALYTSDRLSTQLNEQQLLTARTGATDGFSSPEEQPSSPRQQQQQQQQPNTGARPKKSPRKQKAL